ncbi:MAG: WYL domain-containing protein [Actinomycetaceae bacterium]|nr:WYL domain-containing protein [Actinomycetaceae bacterium]
MTTREQRAGRILSLLALLVNSRRPLTKQEILANVPDYAAEAAPERAFERDKKVIKDLLGITFTHTHDLFDETLVSYSLDEADAAADCHFSEDEALLLHEAAQLWRCDAGAPAIFGLLDTLAPRPAGAAASPSVAASSRYIAASATIFTAIVLRQRISFRYRSREGKVARRLVAPWRLVERNDIVYVQGFDEDRQKARVFHLGRLCGSVTRKPEAGTFSIPADIDEYPLFSLPLVSPVLKGFSARLSRYIVEVDVTGARMSEAAEDEWVSRILFDQGDITVVEPASLAAKVHAAWKHLGDIDG